MNNEVGHQVVAIGCLGAPATWTPNAVGYANLIVIQNQFASPTTGSTSYYRFGGSSGNIGAALTDAGTASIAAPQRFINLSRQIQLVFRVITREMDPIAQLRPDNL